MIKHNIIQEICGKRCHTCGDQVIQVPICIEKNLFCSIQEIDGLVYKKNRQSRKFGILASKIWSKPVHYFTRYWADIIFSPLIKASNSAENWRKMSCDNPKLGIVNNNMYAKYDPNPSILSQDIVQKPILGINQGPLTLLKWIWDLCANNMHIFRPWPNHLWSFKTILA